MSTPNTRGGQGRRQTRVYGKLGRIAGWGWGLVWPCACHRLCCVDGLSACREQASRLRLGGDLRPACPRQHHGVLDPHQRQIGTRGRRDGCAAVLKQLHRHRRHQVSVGLPNIVWARCKA